MLEYTVYHKLLRISVLVLACVLVFQSGLIIPHTAKLANGTQLFMANAVGVYVGVAPTELNQLTAEVTAQRLALDAREQALGEREIAVGLNDGGVSQSTTTFVLSGLVFILLVLMILNYTLDYMRMRRMAELLSRQERTAFP